MEPEAALDRFRRREIEQQLTAELQDARNQLLTASTDFERLNASESFSLALQRFRDFVAKGVIPAGFGRRAGPVLRT